MASILYAEKSQELERKNEEIKQAYKDMRTARMKATTRDAKNPLIVEANNWIKKLKEERAVIYEEIKPLRKQADEGVDKKALNEQYRKSVNGACSVKNTGGLRNQTADQVRQNFTTAREQSMKYSKPW